MDNEILVAVDGSEHSTKVVSAATDLAKKTSSKILLVSVINPPPQEPEGIRAYEKVENFPDAYAEYLKAITDHLTEKLSKQIQSQSVQHRVVTPSGNPAKEILELADLDKVKSIVIGLKGQHHGIGLIGSLGSVSRRVIENSKVPVLVVP